jgi:imidazolonepropionase-like amidohydrolase
MSPSLAFVGGTLVDGTGAVPRPDAAVVIEDGRVEWTGPASELDPGRALQIVNASGKHVVPGLIDANVHLLLHCDPDVILRYDPGEYDELVLEAAQVALKAGITTVFDTWGPLESLRRVRDRINAGEAIGSRIFLAGNIIGNDGPWSVDFDGRSYGQALNPVVVESVNRHWEQGVGGDLPWMPAEQVREAVREYVAVSGVDFVKYSSSVHKDFKFICFSPDAQRAIVEEAHEAGLRTQACTITPEALKLAVEAGVDLIQHANLTGRYPMPHSTVDALVSRRLPCVLFLMTQRFMDAARAGDPSGRTNDLFSSQLENTRNLIDGGANILYGDDAAVWGPTAGTGPAWSGIVTMPDQYMELGRSHVLWFRAASEQGMAPMDALLAATRNTAEAMGKGDELGTIEPGKRGDLLVLDGDPLDDPDNYGRIEYVVKDGRIVDVEELPETPVLTRRKAVTA